MKVTTVRRLTWKGRLVYMTQHRLVWQSRETHTFSVVGERSEPFEVKARPIITNFYWGTTVGLFYRDANSFGYWSSSNTCDPITAWRVAQILPRIRTMRNHGGGYDETLCGLVIAMNGDRHEDRMRERAKDLGMTVEELDAELKRLNGLWPTAVELHSMWRRLPEAGQNGLARVVRQAITDGYVECDDRLVACVEQTEIRLRTAAEQKQHEEDLITKGLDDDPMNSLKQLMEDIGVTNLAYSVGCGDLFEPSHFKWEDLDREIMRELIGDHGFCGNVPLITTAKGPDDPTAHWSSGGGGSITVFGSNFGEETHPKVMLGELRDLAYVRYDRTTERFQVAVRPVGVKHSDEDFLMSIQYLRSEIGHHMGREARAWLEPGTKAPWVTETRVATPPEQKTGWARVKEMLHLG